MTNVNRDWSLSNPGLGSIFVWLEPWAEEFEVPVRSTVTLSVSSGSEACGLSEVEWTGDHLVVWASGAQTVSVFIDGMFQESGSAVNPVPDGLTKHVLKIMFDNQPAARLGGRAFEATERLSWWRRARRRLGL